MNLQRVAVSKLRANPKNPRIIKDEKFQKLVQSIKDFPEMLELRPIVVDADYMVLGGNMRLKACQAAGLKEVPVAIAADLTPDQQREFVVKDNVGFGEWQWDALANEWDVEELTRWGVDVPTEEEEKEAYTAKIVAPTYEITGQMPSVADLCDTSKHDALVAEINKTKGLSSEVKAFLQYAATRHVVFDYAAIAEFYAHANPSIQRLMEASALVIIDYDKAIQQGFVQLSDSIRGALQDDYETVEAGFA